MKRLSRIDDIIPLIINENSNVIKKTLAEYFVLHEKVNDIDHQSFYFKKAKDSHLKTLERLRKEYAELTAFFNSNDLNTLIALHNECNQTVDATLPIFVKVFKTSSIESQKNLISSCIELKSKFDYLESLDSVMNDETFLISVFES